MFSLMRGGVGAILIVAASAAVAFADSATSVGPAAGPSSSSGTAAPAPDPNKVICRRVEVTGSNMPEHVCKTRAEWASLAEQHDRETKDAIRQTHIPGCGPKGC